MTYCIGREDCGCEIRQDHDAKCYIAYCSMHHYADDMYKALKWVLEDVATDEGTQVKVSTRTAIWKALAKAESK
jgi:hypothetical protein